MMRVASRRTAYRLKRCSPSLVRNALRHFITDTFPFRCVTLRATSFLVNKTPAPHREVTGKQARFAGLNSPTIDACDLPAEYSVRMRSEEHTSELQSLMRISYAVFCLKKTRKLSQLYQYDTVDQ